MTTPRPLTVLWSIALGATLLAGAAWLWPIDRAPTPMAPALPPIRQLPPPAFADASAGTERLLDNDLFSPERVAAETREMRAVVDTFPSALPVGDGSGGVGGVASASDDVPQLSGIIDTPNGRRALLRLDSATARAMLYASGDGAAGWRVVGIANESVTLEGPTGRRTLTLTRRSSSP